MMEIVLVEDDPDDIYFFQQACVNLHQAPKVTVLNNGVEFISHVQNSNSQMPVYLLDLNMPHKGGLEALEELQQRGLVNSLLVICYTTSNSPKDIAAAYQLGAKSYLTKPNRLTELTELVQTLIKYWFQYNQQRTG
ncbi:response regulator [Pseudoalteromonas rubra]|uniref:response regulator n=1 Tax=Pseudoalteromonas rubra TaxID=43658 RepID=UPI000F777DEA|nr:response regulator [Pseudoalteromonas rubra]